MLVTDFSHSRILQIDLGTGEMSRLPLTAKKCTGISLDKASRELLYSDQALRTIQSFSLLSRNTTVLYTTGTRFVMFLLRMSLVSPKCMYCFEETLQLMRLMKLSVRQLNLHDRCLVMSYFFGVRCLNILQFKNTQY